MKNRISGCGIGNFFFQLMTLGLFVWGCDSAEIEKSEKFFVVIDKVSDNVYGCNQTGPNGELRAIVFTCGADTVEVQDYGPYLIQWFVDDAQDRSPLSGSDNMLTLNSLESGTYTVIVTRNNRASEDNGEISSVPFIPTPVVTKISDQTVADPPNGELRVDVPGGNEGYEFRWATLLGETISNTNVATSLPTGRYMAEITKDGCAVVVDGVVFDLSE